MLAKLICQACMICTESQSKAAVGYLGMQRRSKFLELGSVPRFDSSGQNAISRCHVIATRPLADVTGPCPLARAYLALPQDSPILFPRYFRLGCGLALPPPVSSCTPENDRRRHVSLPLDAALLWLSTMRAFRSSIARPKQCFSRPPPRTQTRSITTHTQRRRATTSSRLTDTFNIPVIDHHYESVFTQLSRRI